MNTYQLWIRLTYWFRKEPIFRFFARIRFYFAFFVI